MVFPFPKLRAPPGVGGAGVGARAAKRLETQRELSRSVNSPSVAASWLFHQGLGRSPVTGPIELANPVGKSPLMSTFLSCVSLGACF